MSLMQSDRRVTVASLIAALLLLALALVYLFSEHVGSSRLNWSIDTADVLGAAICAALCFILYSASDKGEELRRVWLLLGIGLAMWTLAELFYAYYELVVLEDAPDYSVADLLWVPAYIPIIAAFWLRFRLLRVPLTRGQWSVLVGGFAALAVISAVYVIVPNLPEAGDVETSGDVISLALGILYPVGDLLMALGAGLMIVAMTGGRFSQIWLLVAMGCLAIALGDSLYYAGLASGSYSTDPPIGWFTAISDISYFAGYVLIALGLYSQGRLQRAL